MNTNTGDGVTDIDYYNTVADAAAADDDAEVDEDVAKDDRDTKW